MIILKKIVPLFSFFLFLCIAALAQDTLRIDTTGKVASTPAGKKKKVVYDSTYNPNVAVRRSLILPGWGQITNKKYWKLPLVYGALGTTGYLFFRNLSQYRDAKNAYILATDNNPLNDDQIKQPYFSVKDQPERIRSFRNSVRQNIDYSVLFFIAFWGLNVADAAVDAHLKTFNVNDDLSLQIKPGYSPMANTNGVSLVLNIGK
ncbi:MAG: hypothetical protein EOO03_03390 [Chitinophagaceae bacterium]|nr:MAG: hypothetical protein EOO03_03390 [Chitinophagaceae bacterium]